MAEVAHRSADWFTNEDFWRDFYGVLFPPERFALADEQVRQLLALIQVERGAVLDLCCGPGRHCLPFARRGFVVTGVDRSPFLLSRAHQFAADANLEVEWIREDMRHFSRPQAFDLVCNLFTSFGYFATEEDDREVVRLVHENLKPGGVFVIDLLGKERMALLQERPICTDFEDGSFVVQRPKVLADWCRIANEWTLVKDGVARSFQYEHNIYSGRELRDLLRGCGFAEVRLYGDLAGSPYGFDAPRLVAVGRKV
jgi:SAM-dependent methyltransferase